MPKKIPTVPPKLLRRQGKGHTSYSCLKWSKSVKVMRRSLVLLDLLKQVLVDELDGHGPVGLAILKVWDAEKKSTVIFSSICRPPLLISGSVHHIDIVVEPAARHRALPALPAEVCQLLSAFIGHVPQHIVPPRNTVLVPASTIPRNSTAWYKPWGMVLAATPL